MPCRACRHDGTIDARHPAEHVYDRFPLSTGIPIRNNPDGEPRALLEHRAGARFGIVDDAAFPICLHYRPRIRLFTSGAGTRGQRLESFFVRTIGDQRSALPT